MKTLPALSEHELAQVLVDQYGLHPLGLSFNPGGEDNWGYRVISVVANYYLKVYRRPLNWDIVLGIPDWLCHEHGFTNVVAPLRTRDGALYVAVTKYTLALFPYIEGALARDTPLTDEQWNQVGRLLARLHASPIPLPCEQEPFAPTNGADFLRVINALPEALGSPNAYQHALAEALLPLREPLLDQYAVFEASAREAQSAAVPFVLTHGDPTGGNILVADQLYIIDWDGLLLAPKERDLVSFTGAQQRPVLVGYSALAGPATLDKRILAFYRYQWNIGEVAGFGTRLLFEAPDEAQEAHDLAQLKHFLDYSGLSDHALPLEQ